MCVISLVVYIYLAGVRRLTEVGWLLGLAATLFGEAPRLLKPVVGELAATTNLAGAPALLVTGA